MTENKPSKPFFVVFALLIAPIVTMINIGDARLAWSDSELRPYIYITIAGDLFYVAFTIALISYGETLNQYLMTVASYIGTLDPHIIWEPSHIAVTLAIFGFVFLGHGYRQIQFAQQEESGL